MTVTIVVGNPKPQSRTFHAAELVAERLTGKAPDERIDLASSAPACSTGPIRETAAAKATVSPPTWSWSPRPPTRAPTPGC